MGDTRNLYRVPSSAPRLFRGYHVEDYGYGHRKQMVLTLSLIWYSTQTETCHGLRSDDKHVPTSLLNKQHEAPRAGCNSHSKVVLVAVVCATMA